MRKILAGIAILLMMSFGKNSEFCDGWNDGYSEGYCYEQTEGCYAPQAPTCPFANVNANTYKDGYNRGFQRGVSEQ